jgi:hypothetical protein
MRRANGRQSLNPDYLMLLLNDSSGTRGTADAMLVYGV